ncbi:hypothetical protein LINPERPRIM_LOCUS29495, partial [Linum perenne]
MHTATEEGITLASQVVTFSDSTWFLVAPSVAESDSMLDTEARLMTPLLRLLAKEEAAWNKKKKEADWNGEEVW